MSSAAWNEAVALDAWPLIRQFRDAGGASFETLGVTEARRVYELSCARNAVPLEPMARVEDLSVGPDVSVPARLYLPTTAPKQPAVTLFLHGGGWVIGSLDTHDALCRYVAHRSGSAILAVDYRLAPEHPYPAAVTDARAALMWLLSHPPELGFKASRIAVMGDSAGGGLAAVLAQEDSHSPEAPVLAAQVLLYPVTDLASETDSYQRVVSGFPLTARTMSWFAEMYAADPSDRLRAEVSPLRGNFTRTPAPAFVCTVGHDPLADEGIAYAGALAQHGGLVEHLHLPEHAHGLFTSAGRIATGRIILDRAANFIATTISGTSEAAPSVGQV